MHPVLLELGALRVGSYGLALTLAFAAGIALGVWRARRAGLPAEPVLGVSIVIVVASIAGSRLFYAWNPPDGAAGGGAQGLSVMGGFPTALFCAWAYFRLRRLPILTYMDLLAPSVALGAGITRIGCFFNGCCHGLACDWPWAVRFPAGSLPHAHLGDVAIHPTQLYQSLLGFAIAGGLLLHARRKPPAGSVVSALVCTWGAQRLLAESFRFHQGGEIWFRLGDGAVSVYQGVALLLVALGAAGWLTARKRLKVSAAS
ncbi:MAG: prolipoprotein diacylglyceryl transferase [Myxococcota bacterium]